MVNFSMSVRAGALRIRQLAEKEGAVPRTDKSCNQLNEILRLIGALTKF